jgi:hypothetical protein
MSLPSYEKNYDVGSVRLDAPYADFVYELPLLSFGDVLHTVNLSLTYQSKMSGNPYKIANGFGLNMQKRLIVYDDTAYGYEDGNGTSILLNPDSTGNVSIFSDGSGRIVRKVNSTFVLENPDFSTETYDNNYNLKRVSDKYGHVILEYTYTGDILDSIAYRPGVTNKKILLAYNSSNALESISYCTGSLEVCKTNLVYLVSGGIKVQHYSGVDYYVIPNGASFTAYSRDYITTALKNYYHSIECNISTNSSEINYPVNALQTESVDSLKNIVFILIDSWNPRAFTEECMPNIYEYARKNLRYDNHWGCSNGTKSSVFGLFFGLSSYYWDVFDTNRVSPLLVDRLLDLNYSFQVYPSAQLYDPPFARVIFNKVDNVRV